MSQAEDKLFLERQLAFFLAEWPFVKDDPAMSINTGERIKALEAELAAFPEIKPEAKLSLSFYNKVVFGSMGIKASFSGKSIAAIQKIVAADYLQRVAAETENKGKRKNKDAAELYLTAVKHGSFGFELGKLSNDPAEDDSLLADTLGHVVEIIEKCAGSDADYETLTETVGPEILGPLKEFLKLVSQEEAGIILESGAKKYDLTTRNSIIAFDRVSKSFSEPEIIKLEGTFFGLPTRYLFELETSDMVIKGSINDNIPEDTLRECNNQVCEVNLKKTIITYTGSRKPRENYELVSVEKK